jgi:hypothetical protein
LCIVDELVFLIMGILNVKRMPVIMIAHFSVSNGVG